MPGDNFVKVFDVVDSGFKDWKFAASGLTFVAIGLVIFFAPKLMETSKIPYLDVKSKSKQFFRYFFLGFSILWTATIFILTYSSYLHHQELARNGGCRTVEGPVLDFVPMPYGGHAMESLTVSGVKFSYSDYIISDGFNNTSSHGGPISKDEYVRICYDPSNNQILRLEIRDFKGKVKDHSKSKSLFPKDGEGSTTENRPIKFPWYWNLFLVFYLMDFFALLFLFIPYVKTYFIIKKIEGDDCPIPQAFAKGKKINLRNTVILWDQATNAIWLRPQGFNLFQAQLMVAKLNVDESNRAVTSREIRFSSGFPFIMVLFFWTAFKFFSLTMPANSQGPSPSQFVGFAAVFFTIVGFIKMKIIRARMEKLIDDAISEIKGW